MSKIVLVVDDDTAFRESVRDIIQMHGYKVIEADDGQTALPIIENQKVDLVLTDILMPEIEGNTLVANVRALKPNLKVIGMTGGGRIGSADDVEELCSPLFFGKILTKPFIANELITQIKIALA